jgi:hypothetical protein
MPHEEVKNEDSMSQASLDSCQHRLLVALNTTKPTTVNHGQPPISCGHGSAAVHVDAHQVIQFPFCCVQVRVKEKRETRKRIQLWRGHDVLLRHHPYAPTRHSLRSE